MGLASRTEGYIYILTDDTGGPFFNKPMKIGVTKDPEDRFRAAKTWFPHGVFVVACVPVMTRATELDIHLLLTGYKTRNRGEWFDFNGEYCAPGATIVHVASAEHRGLVAPYTTELHVISCMLGRHFELHKAEIKRRAWGDCPQFSLALGEEFVEYALNTAAKHLWPNSKMVSDALLSRQTAIIRRQQETEWESPLRYFFAPLLRDNHNEERTDGIN